MNNFLADVILIDAPTGSGKTRYIKSLGAVPSNTLTSEQLIDALLEMCRNNTSLDNLANKLQHIYYFENLESLCGREDTQRLAASLIMRISKQHRTFSTGINFKEKLPFFMATICSYELVQPPN